MQFATTLFVCQPKNIFAFGRGKCYPPDVPRKYRRLINNRTKIFRLKIIISFSLNKTNPNLDFEINTVEIC